MISTIYAIDRSIPTSLCGELNCAFWHSEWGYPPIGVYFADTPSAGHEMLCLDYRHVAGEAEPRVVHVDQEADSEITIVAETFEDFIRGLQPEGC